MMFNDEMSDKDSDERDSDSSPRVTRKCLSTVGFRNSPDRQCVRPLALRATQSFTGTLDELKLTTNVQRLNLCDRTNSLNVQKAPVVCPCGCLLRPMKAGPFRTREQKTLALHVVSSEVLNHHGYAFQPSEIAMFWKKDCRMFLWKGNAKNPSST